MADVTEPVYFQVLEVEHGGGRTKVSPTVVTDETNDFLLHRWGGEHAVYGCVAEALSELDHIFRRVSSFS